MMLEFRLDFPAGSGHLRGIGLGLVSMGCYAAFILINRVIDASVHVHTRTFYQLLVGGLIMLPMCLSGRPELPPWTWPWLAGTGLVPGFFAILCAVYALSRLPAATFGTIAYFEPIAVVVFGWTLFGETLSALQLAGCLVIIAGGVSMTWLVAGRSGERVDSARPGR